jgi:hypothetical protein
MAFWFDEKDLACLDYLTQKWAFSRTDVVKWALRLASVNAKKGLK